MHRITTYTNQGTLRIEHKSGFSQISFKRPNSSTFLDVGTIEVSRFGWFTTSAMGTKFDSFSDALAELLEEHNLPQVDYVEPCDDED